MTASPPTWYVPIDEANGNVPPGLVRTSMRDLTRSEPELARFEDPRPSLCSFC